MKIRSSVISISISVIFLEFWEDDGEIRIGGRAGMVFPYFRAGRNPYVFCPHHIRMWMVTDIRRPSDSLEVAGAGWGKRNVVSFHFFELVIGITEMEMLSITFLNILSVVLIMACLNSSTATFSKRFPLPLL